VAAAGTYRFRVRSFFLVGRRSGLLQLLEPFLEFRQALHQLAFLLVGLRLPLHLFPAFLGILQTPLAPFLGIIDLSLGQVFQGVKILFQIEDAIAQLIIEALAVELVAVFQARKHLLGHTRVENLAFELVDGGILSMQRGPGDQKKGKGAVNKAVHVGSPSDLMAAIQPGGHQHDTDRQRGCDSDGRANTRRRVPVPLIHDSLAMDSPDAPYPAAEPI